MLLAAGGVTTCGVVRVSTEQREQALCWGATTGNPDAPVNVFAPDERWPVAGLPCAFGGCSRRTLSLTVGVQHACVVATHAEPASVQKGTVFCWGYDYAGQLGVGSTAAETCADGAGTWRCSRKAVPIASSLTFSAVSAGTAHTCALTTDSLVYCWGANASGQLGATVGEQCFRSPVGDDQVPCSKTPILAVGGMRFSSIVAGQNATCGLQADNLVICWGSKPMIPVPDGRRYATISGTSGSGGSSEHFCGISTPRGEVYCWGTNGFGELGNGTNTDSRIPVRVKEPQ